PAQRVHQVVAADAETVAITRGHPDGELGVGGLHAHGERGRASVDGVEAIRIHVVRKAAGAADAADPDDVVRQDAELGHHALDVGQDAVVTAARTPTDV